MAVDEVDDLTADNFEPLLSAAVEADADGDGFGDESEDACPSSAVTNGACPIVSRPPALVSPAPTGAVVSTAATRKVGLATRSATLTGGRASIKLKNSNAVRVKGKVKLKLGKKVVGSRAYALATGAVGTVKVKLAKVARKRIGRRGKVKLSLSLTAKGTTGATFKTFAKLTVKKAPRRKRTTTPGGSPLDGIYRGGHEQRARPSFHSHRRRAQDREADRQRWRLLLHPGPIRRRAQERVPRPLPRNRLDRGSGEWDLRGFSGAQ